MNTKNDDLVQACRACVAHARHLVESAKLVMGSGRRNIAYHLATLALEEMGRRELFQLHEMANRFGEAPPWQEKATQDHVKKLFWCLYSIGGLAEVADQNQFFEKRQAAADIHENRLLGLYVERTELSFNIPMDAISEKQAQAIIRLAEGVVAAGEAEEPRDVPPEEHELQGWLLNAFDDTELRTRILNKESIERLKAADNVASWARSLRSEIEASDAELRKLVEAEMRRTPESLGDADKERWRIQFRLRTASNSIRPKPLKNWNEKVRWIKFHPQQGALSKLELIAEITIGDNIPLRALESVATSFSIQLVMALNLATSGFWWWQLPPNQQKVYERIRDLEKHLDVQSEDQSFKVFTKKVPLTDVHMDNLLQCLAALPDPHEVRAKAYESYMGGLTFTALNCVQWRCEAQAFVHFLRSFTLLMREAGFSNDGEPTDAAVERFVNEKFPNLDAPEQEKLLELIRTFCQRPKLLREQTLAMYIS